MRTRSGKGYHANSSPRNAQYKGQVRKVEVKKCGNCERLKVELDIAQDEVKKERLLRDVAEQDISKLNDQVLAIQKELEIERALRMSSENKIKSLMEKIPPYSEKGESEEDNRKDETDTARKSHDEVEIEAVTKLPEKLLQKIVDLNKTLDAQVAVFEGYRQWVESAKFDTNMKFEEFSSAEIDKILEESKLIGSGGYGKVYKASMMERTVAVKVRDQDSQQGLREYNSEVALLKKVHHQNLVHLVGACESKGALVYEYLENGSLKQRLGKLSWQKRIAVALDMCSALIFLHNIRPRPVVHGDLKPDNILFDADDNMKLSDFGICHQLANVTNSGTWHHITQGIPRGSPGYMDPEFSETSKLTPLADEYAFGVILLQLVTGKDSTGLVKMVEAKMKNFAGLKNKSLLLQRRVLNKVGLIDSALGLEGWDPQAVLLLLQLGLACTDPVSKKRPKSFWICVAATLHH